MGIMHGLKWREGRAGHYQHWCPGCNQRHEIAVGEPNGSGAKWSFNGNFEAATFSPSIHIQIGPYIDPDDPSQNEPKYTQCHYFIKDGKIQFLTDCKHDMRGMTVDIPDFHEASRR